MTKVAILMAEGYEESETMLLADLLRRAGIEAVTFSTTGEQYVKGMNGIMLKADRLFSHDAVSECNAVFFPGGRPGGPNLIADPEVIRIAREFNEQGKFVTAMCFGTRVLPAAGIIEGRRLTGYTGYEQFMEGACFLGDELTVTDGNMVTSQGPATVMPFAFALIEALGKDTADIKKRMLYDLAGGR
ncbi:MAG: DJ-1/PfpI family protein [Solobacterium sp.]|nr:DJ-1/PfpI family protein [Solobacterium sp.]